MSGELGTVAAASPPAAGSSTWAILVAELKRRSRRISSSISCWALRRSLNRSALALFHREKRTSVGGRCEAAFELGEEPGFSDGGAKMGNGRANFSAILLGRGEGGGESSSEREQRLLDIDYARTGWRIVTSYANCSNNSAGYLSRSCREPWCRDARLAMRRGGGGRRWVA